eukprot:4141463-Amphidinium_carterae.1
MGQFESHNTTHTSLTPPTVVMHNEAVDLIERILAKSKNVDEQIRAMKAAPLNGHLNMCHQNTKLQA